MSEDSNSGLDSKVISIGTRKPLETNPILYEEEEGNSEDFILGLVMSMLARMHENLTPEAWKTLDRAVIILGAKDSGEIVFTNGNIHGTELVGALETAKLFYGRYI